MRRAGLPWAKWSQAPQQGCLRLLWSHVVAVVQHVIGPSEPTRTVFNNHKLNKNIFTGRLFLDTEVSGEMQQADLCHPRAIERS